MTRISVVIATRDRPDELARCLKALQRLEWPGVEVVVVDASSTDETRDLVEPQGGCMYLSVPPHLAAIPYQENYGVEAASGDIIAMIDDDAIPEPDWIEQLVRAFEIGPEVGVVGGRGIDATYWPWDGHSPIGRLLPDGRRTQGFNGNPGQIIDVDYVVGLNMAFRREVFKEVGGFDERFEGTAAFFEPDFCLRVRRRGYKVLFNPCAVVYHLPSSKRPINRASAFAIYHARRNEFYFLRKHFGVKPSVVIRALARTLFWYRWRLLAVDAVRTIQSYFLGIIGALSGIRRPIPDPVDVKPAEVRNSRPVGERQHLTGFAQGLPFEDRGCRVLSEFEEPN